jgi:8-amino-7-oxononanoate synthase
MYNDDFLSKKINERITDNAFRSLQPPANKIDFSSNDYLGIATNQLLSSSKNDLNHGSMGSRLLSGNYPLIEVLEKEIAEFHDAAAALIFNSGYDANIGLLSSVPQRGDTILYDYLSHASIRDGIRLSLAQSFSFAHNDLNDLEKKMAQATGNIFVVTESVFSMDGDQADLLAIIKLANKFKAHLIIDEAHATGVIGDLGEGLVQCSNIQNQIFARIHTFGKALGCHGAVVLGSLQLRNYLINFAKSFIYTTALPPVSIAAIQKTYQLFPVLKNERTHINLLVKQFQLASIKYDKLKSVTPIQIVMVPGNNEVKQLAKMLQDAQLDIRPILYPTVLKNKERLRITLHAFNTEDQLNQLIQLLQ